MSTVALIPPGEPPPDSSPLGPAAPRRRWSDPQVPPPRGLSFSSVVVLPQLAVPTGRLSLSTTAPSIMSLPLYSDVCAGPSRPVPGTQLAPAVGPSGRMTPCSSAG